MSGRFTDSIEPLALAARGRLIEGRLALSAMPRLVSLLQDNRGDVEFSLQFGMDQGGTPNVQGMIKCELVLECQRCMGNMDFRLESELHLGIVSSRDAAQRLPARYDPLLLDGEEISIAGIVEDELILALPLVAMHEIEDCPAGDKILARPKGEASEGQEPQVSSRKNPFAALAQLKGQLPTDSSNTDEE